MVSRRYPHFAIMTLGALLITHLTLPIASYISDRQADSDYGSHRAFQCSAGHEAEACFAYGQRIAFRDADLFSLQLVSGIGEDLAHSIITARPAICAAARRLAPDSEWMALTQAPGVGETLSRRFASYLSLSRSDCESMHP